MGCRLLYVVGQLRPGGLEHQLCLLLEGMDLERYRPEVVVWNFREDDIYVPRIRALRVPLHSLSNITSKVSKVRAFRRMVKQLQPDAVHSYSFYTNFAAWWAALGTKTVPIGSLRGDFTQSRRKPGWLLGRLSARWPHSQIFNSFAAAEKARRSRSFFAPRLVHTVRNGLDLQRFKYVPLPTEGRVRILGIGSLRPIKRWDRLLVAAMGLKRRGLDCLVQIAGAGPSRESLEQQAQNLGVADRVEFLGHADNVPDLLASATFLAHTSDSEGCPNVVMEAMACGRAVAAMDVGDIPSLVENGTTGFVVRRGDDAMLLTRMATLITNCELRRRMGEAGRARAEREFGLDRLVSQTFAAYRAAGLKDT